MLKANNSACTGDGKFCSKDFDLSVSLQGFCHSLVPLWKYSFVFYDRIERLPVASLVRDLCWSKQYLVFALPPLGRLLFSDFTIGDKYTFGMFVEYLSVDGNNDNDNEYYDSGGDGDDNALFDDNSGDEDDCRVFQLPR